MGPQGTCRISKPPFDGYEYQDRATELADQLRERSDDFGKFVLPAPDQWRKQKANLSREEQIQFLAPRLRLLNCFQQGWPGDVSYRDEQYLQAHGPWPEEAELKKLDQVINPYVELLQMKIEVCELPALVPFLAEDNFVPTFSFWRPWHPDWTLHRVNWLVEELINDVGKRDLAQRETYTSLDKQGRQQHLGDFLQWCRENAGRSRTDLLLETLRESHSRRWFLQAAQEAAELRLVETLPLVHDRMSDLPGIEVKLVHLWYVADTADAVPYARKWVKSDDEDTRYWATLILLRHGSERQQRQAVSRLANVFEEGDMECWAMAVEPLLASKTDEAGKLACQILSHEDFSPGRYGGRIVLHHLFLAGRQSVSTTCCGCS